MQHNVKSNLSASGGPAGEGVPGRGPVGHDGGPIPFPGPRAAHPGPDEAPERLVGPGPGGEARPEWARGVPDAKVTGATRQLRKVWVLIAGTAVIVFAVIIAPLPGPGFTIFAPIGFAMLASEFLWAKRLMNELEYRTGFIERAAAHLVRTRNWWFLPTAIAIFWGLVFWLDYQRVLSSRYLFPIAGGVFAPVGYLAWRTIVHWRNARRASRPPQGDQPGG